MLKFSKKLEYALISIFEMSDRYGQEPVTTKTIAMRYDIPLEILGKVLQTLVKHGLITSIQGVKGGYALAKNPEEIALLDVILAMEPHYKLTKCMKNEGGYHDCSHWDCCQIRDPLAKVQIEIDNLFQRTKLSNIL